MRNKSKKNIGRFSSLILLAIISLLISRMAAPPEQEVSNNSQTINNSVQVHFIDVGQGDSILIEAEDSAMLIDAGENNMGATVVKYLKDQGIERLDYVIGTHPHSDHIGGLDDVIDAIPVDRIIMPDVVHTTKTFEDVLDSIEAKNLRITKAVAGDTYELGPASFIVIAPNSDHYEELNDYSVGIKFMYGKTSFLMAGDAEGPSEKEMLSNGLDLSANVLKLSHHGSAYSTSASFLEAVNPEYAVITVGEDNNYGHPHKESILALKDRSIPIYRTDKQQTIIFSTDGSNISVNTSPYED